MSAQDRRLDFLDNVVLVAAAMIITALLVYSTWFAPPQNITPTVACFVVDGEWACSDADGERVYTYPAKDLGARGCHVEGSVLRCGKLPVTDGHAQETIAVVAERRLAECLGTLRLCARVTARYEAGAQVCKPRQLQGDLP